MMITLKLQQLIHLLFILCNCIDLINCQNFNFNLNCNICQRNGLLRKYEINENIIENLSSSNKRKNITKRYSIDPAFKGHPKTKAETLEIKFNMNAEFRNNDNKFMQSGSLIGLLNKIVIEYLNRCPPFILYDTFVEKSESFILQNLFRSFPFTFYHGKINKNYQLENKNLLENGDHNCRTYILFLSDPSKTHDIIGPQLHNKVIVVARSSQWKLRDFLSSIKSSKIINLLVIGESLTIDPKKEKPFVLYTHRLYSDGLGSNYPIVLTSWIKGMLSRPHINLFPSKFIEGFAGHSFIVAAVDQPPFIFRRKYLDTSGTLNIFWEGIEYRLLKLLSKRLNFTFEVTEPENAAQLGSGEAIREAVQYGKADIGMAGAYITVDRLKMIDMSVGHTKDCAAFITLASKALPKYRAIMGPFQWPVWVALTAVYLLGIFPLAYTDQLSLSHLIGNWGEIENMFWYVFGTFTNSLSFSGKYSWSNSEKLSTRLLIGFYWMFTIIITASYTGSIIAFVTLPAFPDTIDSVYDLLGLFFRVGTLNKGGWNMWFNNSDHEPTIKLYKKMEFVDTIEEGIGNVSKSFFWNYAFLGSRAQLEYLVQSNFSVDGFSKRSVLHLSEECFAPFQVGFTFPKNSVYADRINEAILKIQRSGLLLKFENEVSWIMQRSSTGRLLQASSEHALKEMIREDRQLTTADTEGMFLLMGIGYLLGALALISEVIGGFTNKCRQIIKRRKRSVVSIISASSKGSTDNKRTEDEQKIHMEKRAERKKDHDARMAARNRFPGLSQLNLTKATLKELYSGYNKKEPTFIVQNDKIILETEAISEDSSLNLPVTSSSTERILEACEQNEWFISTGNVQYETTVHYEDLEQGHNFISEINRDETIDVVITDENGLILEKNDEYQDDDVSNDYDDDNNAIGVNTNVDEVEKEMIVDCHAANLEENFGEPVDHSIGLEEKPSVTLFKEHNIH